MNVKQNNTSKAFHHYLLANQKMVLENFFTFITGRFIRIFIAFSGYIKTIKRSWPQVVRLLKEATRIYTWRWYDNKEKEMFSFLLLAVVLFDVSLQLVLVVLPSLYYIHC